MAVGEVVLSVNHPFTILLMFCLHCHHEQERTTCSLAFSPDQANIGCLVGWHHIICVHTKDFMLTSVKSQNFCIKTLMLPWPGKTLIKTFPGNDHGSKLLFLFPVSLPSSLPNWSAVALVILFCARSCLCTYTVQYSSWRYELSWFENRQYTRRRQKKKKYFLMQFRTYVVWHGSCMLGHGYFHTSCIL